MDEILNLMSAAIEKKPTEFQNQLEQILYNKATAAVEAKRVEIAQSLYGEATDEEEDLETETEELEEEEDEDLEESLDEEDEDLDLDFDLDDLDLDDLEEDLEELEGEDD
jgi:hypothetical protein